MFEGTVGLALSLPFAFFLDEDNALNVDPVVNGEDSRERDEREILNEGTIEGLLFGAWTPSSE